ncbi:MAG: hypothetical protein ACF8R7_05885 [Phycisphaerales bacterium JB039]
MNRRTALRDAALVISVSAIVIMAMSSVGAAQYALDRNQRVNTQVSGIGYQRNANFGQRNLYRPGVVAARTPYTLNRNTGTVIYNPNQAFGQPLYRPTGYGISSGSAAYQQRFRY